MGSWKEKQHLIIENGHKRATRCVYEERCSRLNIQTILQRRKILTANFCARIIQREVNTVLAYKICAQLYTPRER